MTKRGAMFPTWLLTDKDFVKLPERQQLLFMKLWLSPNLDCAGFHPLQIGKWARSFTPRSTDAEMRDAVDGLETAGWIVVDYDIEEVFLRPFIRVDAQKQPQIYVSACRAVQAAQSPELRRAAWEQVVIVHPPKLKPDPRRTAETTERLERQQTIAYEELQDFMESQGEGFRQAAGSLPEGSVVVAVGSEGEPGGEGGGAEAGDEAGDEPGDPPAAAVRPVKRSARKPGAEP